MRVCQFRHKPLKACHHDSTKLARPNPYPIVRRFESDPRLQQHPTTSTLFLGKAKASLVMIGTNEDRILAPFSTASTPRCQTRNRPWTSRFQNDSPAERRKTLPVFRRGRVDALGGKRNPTTRCGRRSRCLTIPIAQKTVRRNTLIMGTTNLLLIEVSGLTDPAMAVIGFDIDL